MKPPNRVNSDFQTAYFLAGACHTPDGAYAVLCSQRENREVALFEAESHLAEFLGQDTPIARMFMRNYDGAKAELAFIDKCIQALQPHRRYKDLPDAEAHEASQQEEWKLELIHRAENHMLTSGTIPADHFATMRMHPEFKTAIVPAIKRIDVLMLQEGGKEKLLELCAEKEFDLPLLLGAK